MAAAPSASPMTRASVPGFLAWWSSELSDALATRSTRRRPWRVMFLRAERGCYIYLRTRDRIELIGLSRPGDDKAVADLRRRLGRAKVTPAQVVLRLQPSEVVQARLNVPA